MNCQRHPSKRVVASCRDCGTGFCIECVRETDQTALCPECHRRRVDEVAREFTPSAGEEDLSVAGQVLPVESGAPYETGSAETSTVTAKSESTPPSRPVEKTTAKTVVPELGETIEEKSEAADFLALGPDDDFSELEKAGERHGLLSRIRSIRARGETRAATAGLRGEAPVRGDVEVRQKEVAVGRRAREAEREETQQVEASTRIASPPGSGPSTRPMTPSEEALLEDVVCALLRPEDGMGREAEAPVPADKGVPAAGKEAVESVEEVLSTLLRPGAEERTATAPHTEADSPVGEATVEVEGVLPAPEPESTRRKKERLKTREERARRWSFLAQPRASEYTLIAVSWWRATLFVILMLLLGIVLWAVPNAYLVPRDTEYGIHAVIIGIIVGLCFWWKAGKKHSTKLAVQAALVTFFSLFLGEFIHWFLIVMKNKALRTIFFDLVSLRFIWEHGAEIMRHTVEAMFPGAFVWIMILPTLLAFIIGFGMPPIPEVFFQFGRAVRE